MSVATVLHGSVRCSNNCADPKAGEKIAFRRRPARNPGRARVRSSAESVVRLFPMRAATASISLGRNPAA